MDYIKHIYNLSYQDQDCPVVNDNSNNNNNN